MAFKFSSKCLVILSLLSATWSFVDPRPPTLPHRFDTEVNFAGANGRQIYKYFYDGVQMKEKYIYVNRYQPNSTTTTIVLYHENTTECTVQFNCATEVTYTTEASDDCRAKNVANTLNPFLGWLTNDPFTHQEASFVGHNRKHNCDVWRHNSRPNYPQIFNETVCISMDQPSTGTGHSPVPVWDVFNDPQGKVTETTNYTRFQAVEHFPVGTFTPPSSCPPLPRYKR
jgi:hypothetical protein